MGGALMNIDVLKKIGFVKEADNIQYHKCPLCGKAINKADFKDTVSLREYNISGMCQACQDRIYG